MRITLGVMLRWFRSSQFYHRTSVGRFLAPKILARDPERSQLEAEWEIPWNFPTRLSLPLHSRAPASVPLNFCLPRQLVFAASSLPVRRISGNLLQKVDICKERERDIFSSSMGRMMRLPHEKMLQTRTYDWSEDPYFKVQDVQHAIFESPHGIGNYVQNALRFAGAERFTA